MTEAEITYLEERSQMFDFIGFSPVDDRRLIAEVRGLQRNRDEAMATIEECRSLFREWKDGMWCSYRRIVTGFAKALNESEE